MICDLAEVTFRVDASPSGNPIADVAERLDQVGFGSCVERSSSHYPGGTYWLWAREPVEIKLYRSDEAGREDWLVVVVKSLDTDCLQVVLDVVKAIHALSLALHVGIYQSRGPEPDAPAPE